MSPPADATTACQDEPSLSSAVTALGADLDAKNWEATPNDFYFLEYWTTTARTLDAQSAQPAPGVGKDLWQLEQDTGAISNSVDGDVATTSSNLYRQLKGDISALKAACGSG